MFSELLPGDVFERELKTRKVGLLVHTGSVFPKRESVKEDHRYDGDIHSYHLKTPYVELTAGYRTGRKQLSRNGEVQVEWFVKSPSDYEAMIWALDQTEFYLDDTHYRMTKEMLGEDGVTHTWCDEPPYMGLQYLLGYERWAIHQYEHPDLFAELLSAYERMQERRMMLHSDSGEGSD